MSNHPSSPLQDFSVPAAQSQAQDVVRIVVGALPSVDAGARRADAGRFVVDGAASLGIAIEGCTVERLYFLSHNPGEDALSRLSALLLADPVTETASWSLLDPDEIVPEPNTVEVAYRPGVTDVSARELARGMAEIGLPHCEVATGTRYRIAEDLDEAALRRLAKALLCNGTIEHFSLGAIVPHFGEAAGPNNTVESVPLAGLDDAALVALSRKRILSLNAAEMRAIQAFYAEVGRDPTDIELETLAQTWSEHCVHKTFRAAIDFRHLAADGSVIDATEIDGLLRTYIRAATDAVYPEWLVSAFVDNAGIIHFDDDFDLAFKVETHNHPSALEPFGGANTGVGGVVRDIIGVSARPIATTDVLCFAPQNWSHDQLPEGILHPRRIASGVVAGIADYGNKLGLPTVNGAVIYDAGYLGNPLVFCGCVGLLPKGMHPTQPNAGDLIVALGGRTGRDGLHGATFSSVELTHDTVETTGSAVQIGDPITEKGVMEVIEAARDARLYSAITDCGAGGFSSAVGEMGKELGATVELANAPLKYAGLAPWEIWLSEAQERMVLAVPPENLAALEALGVLWDVEVSVLGSFTGDGDLRVLANGKTVAHLPMEFLHDGLPRKRLTAIYQEGESCAEDTEAAEKTGKGIDEGSPAVSALGSAFADILLSMLRHPTIASKESIVRRYDHEVRGGTIVRPFTGPHMDGPADAAVIKPLGTWGHNRAVVLSAGINPTLGKRDPYAMAISAIDEAFRNAVAVGGDPDRIAILDNFCWGNPTLPDRLGTLVRACQGCYDAALAYRSPFISGKDSLYNEFNGSPIPGTLLISAIGIVPDLNRTATSHFKQAGNHIYLVGETLDELGGSLLHEICGVSGGVAPRMPEDPLTRYRALHSAIAAGLVQSAHDLSEGGVAVALAEMALSGRLGATVDLQPVSATLSAAPLLFSESNGRLLVEVTPEDAAAFEATLAGTTCVRVGVVEDSPTLQIARGSETLLSLPVVDLVRAWKCEAQEGEMA